MSRDYCVSFNYSLTFIYMPLGVKYVYVVIKMSLLRCFCSGLIVPERYGNETVPEVVSQSGYALLHFFSDAAYNLTGFNISYR